MNLRAGTQRGIHNRARGLINDLVIIGADSDSNPLVHLFLAFFCAGILLGIVMSFSHDREKNYL